jgi:hypothetical protein
VGKLNIQSTSADFIYAYGDTTPSDPSSPLSPFLEHVDHGDFNLNLKTAQTNSISPPSLGGNNSTSTSGSSGGLSERQWVILTLWSELIIDRSYSRGFDGFDLGHSIPTRSSLHQILQ